MRIIERALRKSHGNGATKLKLQLFRLILACVKFVPLGDVRGGGGAAPVVNLGPPIISETSRATKFKLKTPLNMVKYSLFV